MKKFFLFFASAGLVSAHAQNIQNNPNSNHGNKFEQLGTVLPTPNEYRTASGAPGTKYWQQRCDYDIKGTLDEKQLKFTGIETDTLKFPNVSANSARPENWRFCQPWKSLYTQRRGYHCAIVNTWFPSSGKNS